MSYSPSRVATVFGTFVLLIALACAPDERQPYVRLGGPTADPASPPGPTTTLRLGVASTHSPGPALRRLTALSEYLARRLERPVELVLRRTYLETNELLYQGKVDIAMLCSGAYAIGRDGHGVTALVVPRIGGASTYNALVIARRADGVRSLADLRGRTFAFSDPLSNTGYRYAVARLVALGERPGTFFARSFFTYSHDNSIIAVRDGLADGASVDELVWQELLRADPGLASVVAVVERSEPFPINPVAALQTMPRATRDALTRIFTDMHRDPEGAAVLAALGYEAFVPADDAAYADMTRSWAELREALLRREP